MTHHMREVAFTAVSAGGGEGVELIAATAKSWFSCILLFPEIIRVCTVVNVRKVVSCE